MSIATSYWKDISMHSIASKWSVGSVIVESESEILRCLNFTIDTGGVLTVGRMVL